MAHKPTTFSRTLNDIIDRLYDGNKAALSRDCGIPGPTLHTLCKPKVHPTKARLKALAEVLPEKEASRLLLAAARDVIPEEHQEVMDKNTSMMVGGHLPDDLREVLLFLEREAASDSETASMLRSLGRWAGVLKEED